MPRSRPPAVDPRQSKPAANLHIAHAAEHVHGAEAYQDRADQSGSSWEGTLGRACGHGHVAMITLSGQRWGGSTCARCAQPGGQMTLDNPGHWIIGRVPLHLVSRQG